MKSEDEIIAKENNTENLENSSKTYIRYTIRFMDLGDTTYVNS